MVRSFARCGAASGCRRVTQRRMTVHNRGSQSVPLSMNTSDPPALVELSSRKFVLGCAPVALVILLWGWLQPLPLWLLGTEVFATILGLFIFGSIRYRIHKDALTYGALLI